MAIIKEYETEYGVVADYWKVSELHLHKQIRRATFVFSLHMNKDKSPLYNYLVSVPDDEYEMFLVYLDSLGVVKGCEEYAIQYNEFFADAVPFADPIEVTEDEAEE